MTILIVDDAPDALALARARLQQEGHQIDCLSSGRAALEYLAERTPDLILLDVDMPGMCGFDVCRAIKGDLRLQIVPVIFVSGSDSVADKVRGLDLGAVDYVTKPFDAFELRARVRAALRTRRLQDMLREHSLIDPLTELWNRRALMGRLDEELARADRYGGSLSLLMIDVDEFKQVNDTYGHGVGDRLLCAIAGLIREHCRRCDLPARYGGDEFSVVLPSTSLTSAAALAERFRQMVAGIRLRVDGTDVRATASFGAAALAGPHDSPQDLLARADAALYRSKQAGRNRVEMTGV